MSDLRCHSCSMYVGSSDGSMKLVALFKASAFGKVSRMHRSEVRKRCPSCGWVNIFHPSTKVLQQQNDERIIQVK